MIKLKVQKSPKHDLNVLPLASSANRKKNGHMTVSFFFFLSWSIRSLEELNLFSTNYVIDTKS